jgi:5-(carboxyamino)imidazole ribonucleotide synthase
MSHKPVIALLGGGQLGRMFIENALRYDAVVHVLDPDPQAPCAALAHRFVQGRYDDRDTVMAFASDADVVGIEIEHVNVEALEALVAQGKRVIPDPHVLRTIQDKGLQKRFYAEQGIPSSTFVLLDDGRDAARHGTLLPAFLKARRGGYDGKGVMAITNLDDAAAAFTGPCVLEQQVAIAKELAVLVVRADDGTIVVYDPVEMVFDPRFNLVDHLRAPADISPAVDQEARSLAKRVADAFAAPGLYAVELFLTTDGTVLVNETAPRAHNSGHHSIEACASSQFDQLLRLYLGLPLGSSRLNGHAAMINLVGEGGSGDADVRGLDQVLAFAGTFMHLYGKRETRTGRKMGHITVCAPDQATLEAGIALAKAHARVVPRHDQQHQPTQR